MVTTKYWRICHWFCRSAYLRSVKKYIVITVTASVQIWLLMILETSYKCCLNNRFNLRLVHHKGHDKRTNKMQQWHSACVSLAPLCRLLRQKETATPLIDGDRKLMRKAAVFKSALVKWIDNVPFSWPSALLLYIYITHSVYKLGMCHSQKINEIWHSKSFFLALSPIAFSHHAS